MEGTSGTDTLPTEIIQEIALHIPDIISITSFSLVDHHVDSALATPAIYARRVASRGWDVEPWIEQYPMVDGGAELISTWKKIDFIHEKLEELLRQDVTAAFQLTSPTVNLGHQIHLVPASKLHIGLYMELMDVLIPILKQNRSKNLDNLYHSSYRELLSMVMLHMDEVCCNHTFIPKTLTTVSEIDLLGGMERYMWSMSDPVQRTSFNLVSLLCSDFADHPLFAKVICGGSLAHPRPLRTILMPNTAWDGRNLTQRFANCALSLFMLWSTLLFDPNYSARSLYTIRVPKMSPANSAFQRNWLFPSTFPLSAIEEAGRQWAGYYTEAGGGYLRFSIRAPMHVTLSRTAAEGKTDEDDILFSASGNDQVGSFTMTGSIVRETGTVTAIKSYNHAHDWEYNGLVLPWGLVGVWGRRGTHGGWWWLWPKEDL